MTNNDQIVRNCEPEIWCDSLFKKAEEELNGIGVRTFSERSKQNECFGNETLRLIKRAEYQLLTLLKKMERWKHQSVGIERSSEDRDRKWQKIEKGHLAITSIFENEISPLFIKIKAEMQKEGLSHLYHKARNSALDLVGSEGQFDRDLRGTIEPVDFMFDGPTKFKSFNPSAFQQLSLLRGAIRFLKTLKAET